MTFDWDNMGFNSEDEMNLSKEIPTIYLDRPSDVGCVAEAILDSKWLTAHDREVSARAVMDFATHYLKHADWVKARQHANNIREGNA